MLAIATANITITIAPMGFFFAPSPTGKQHPLQKE
jgi:hypothetical protein